MKNQNVPSVNIVCWKVMLSIKNKKQAILIKNSLLQLYFRKC